jgi:hypothetical protein
MDVLVMGVKMIGTVLAHQGRQVAMHRIFMGAMRLELDCDVGNPEILGDPSANVLEQFAREGAMVLIDQNVTGQHHQSRLDGPHMQIMNVVHARNRFDGVCDV